MDYSNVALKVTDYIKSESFYSYIQYKAAKIILFQGIVKQNKNEINIVYFGSHGQLSTTKQIYWLKKA